MEEGVVAGVGEAEAAAVEDGLAGLAAGLAVAVEAGVAAAAPLAVIPSSSGAVVLVEPTLGISSQ